MMDSLPDVESACVRCDDGQMRVVHEEPLGDEFQPWGWVLLLV